MYNPGFFREERLPVLHDAIRRSGLATLVTSSGAGLEANHVPMLFDADPAPLGKLTGHIARANLLWKNVAPESQALAVFLGPDAYISPAWYPSKQQGGKVVPTWNYIAVHATGTLRFFDESERLLDIVTRLSERHETSRAEPWKVSDAPADYVQTMLKAIVGFELVIAKIEGKSKMSQNREAADRVGVMQGLRSEGGETGARVADIVAQKSD